MYTNIATPIHQIANQPRNFEGLQPFSQNHWHSRCRLHRQLTRVLCSDQRVWCRPSNISWISSWFHQVSRRTWSTYHFGGCTLQSGASQHWHQHVAICREAPLHGFQSYRCPWDLRNKNDFTGKVVPFGCLVYFWEDRKRPDSISRKMSPSSSLGVFLGYHIQSGHVWRDEYLVAHLDGLDYRLADGSVKVIRTKRL